jgi:hypothetical protein
MLMLPIFEQYVEEFGTFARVVFLLRQVYQDDFVSLQVPCFSSLSNFDYPLLIETIRIYKAEVTAT